MRKEFRRKLNGDDSRADASAYFTLRFDTRNVWGKAKVPVKVTINQLAQHGWEPGRSAVHSCECRGTVERGRKSG
jgi:hypothetical protein